MNNKKILAALLAALMLLVNLSPVAAKAASADSPFCRIAYDSNVGCDTVKYYFYVAGTAKYDASRFVKFYNGKILLGINNTTVTSTHKAGTNPAWNTDGSHLIWIEADSSLWSRAYADGINKKIADSVSSLGLNAESMVETVTFSDNTSSSINELLSVPNISVVSDSAITATPTATSKPTAKPTAKPTKAPHKEDKCENYPNKSVFYPKGTTTKYVLKRTGRKLYINGKLVVSGIKNSKKLFCFNKSYYVSFVKNHKLYYASKFKPKQHMLIMQNVKSLNVDKKTGFLSTVNRLKKKLDYVDSKKLKSVLYQNGKKAHVLKTNKAGTKLYLDGKLVDKAKKKKQFSNLGFTENGYICYNKGKIPYKAKIDLPSSKEKMQSNNQWTKNYLGFSSLK